MLALVLCFIITAAQTAQVDPQALDWFRKGEELIGTNRENTPEHLEYLEKAVQISPEFTAARYNLILVYWHRENYSAAMEHCNELIRLNPDDVRGYRLRSGVFNKIGQPQKALFDLEKSKDLAPEDYRIWEELAQLYFLMKQYPEAVQAFNKVVELSPSPVQTYFNLGLAQQYSGLDKDAIASYQKFLANYPDDGDARFLLGMAYRNTDEKEKAIKELIKAEQIKPGDPEISQHLGDLLLEVGRTEEAKQRLGQVGTESARNFSNLGVVAKREGRFDDSLKYFQKAVSLEPSNALIWGHLGDVFSELGRIDESADSYRKAIEIDASDFNSYLNLGILLANQDKNEEAKGLLEKAVEINPESPEGHYGLANVLDRMEDDKNAIYQYQEAIRLDLSDTSRAHFRSAVLYSRQSQVNEAIQHLKIAFQMKPESFVPIVVDELKAVRSDLDAIRYRTEFRELLEEYKDYWNQ